METRTCPMCGTGFEVYPSRPKRFCSIQCGATSRSGAKSYNYRGGLCFDRTHNRWLIRAIDGTIVKYARAVMEAELRRPLRSDEIVHHINGDSTDDRIENLQILTASEHFKLHRPEFEALRIERIKEAWRSKTHCKRGHEFTEENTSLDSRGRRACRTCRRAWARAYYAKTRAAAK